MTSYSNDIISAFVGVNSGYCGDDITIKSPSDAVLKINNIVTFTADVYAGYAIYSTDYGCPNGGEPIGAVFSRAVNKNDWVKFNHLRKKLKQTSLAIVSESSNQGIETDSFTICLGKGDLEQLAIKWQILAQNQKNRGKLFICGAIYIRNDLIYAQAEVNPNKESSNFINDVTKWKADAISLMAELSKNQSLEFRKVGFRYLRS